MLENHVHGRIALKWISGRFISGKRNEKKKTGSCSKAGFGGEYLKPVAIVLRYFVT
jgi:hypothetical protein